VGAVGEAHGEKFTRSWTCDVHGSADHRMNDGAAGEDSRGRRALHAYGGIFIRNARASGSCRRSR